MYSVPVRCGAYGGTGELKGVLRFDGRQLVLQYQVMDGVFHEYRMAPVDLVFPAEAVVEARLSGGFLGLAPAVEVRVSDLQLLAPIPTPEPARMRLRVNAGDRAEARRIVDGINSVCAELRLARLDASLDQLAARDPRSTR